MHKNKDITRNRKITKARFLYLYVIFGSIGGLLYFVGSIFLGWPKHFALSQVYLLVAFIVLWFLYKNWKLMWFYLIDVDRGKLLLFLNKSTHWDDSHKIKVSKWVYLGRNKIRRETYEKISKKVMDGGELNKNENKLFKRKVVFCPQQVKLGFNEAMLVHSLIYSHRNIKPLDDDLREIMNLTDDNILSFDLMREAKKAGYDKYERLVEIGKRKSEQINRV